MKQDRVSIGLDPGGQRIMARIMALGWFDDAQDVARLAMALAIRAKVTEGEATDTDTRWGGGNFDSSGELRSVMLATYPSCEMPVRLMEYLVNHGLRLMEPKLDAADLTPDGLMT